MITDTEVKADIRFALDSGEFAPQSGRKIFGISPMMRYVVALNPELTKTAFIRIAVEVGFNPATAEKQFRQSRKFDLDAYGTKTDKEGRQIDA